MDPICPPPLELVSINCSDCGLTTALVAPVTVIVKVSDCPEPTYVPVGKPRVKVYPVRVPVVSAACQPVVALT